MKQQIQIEFQGKKFFLDLITSNTYNNIGDINRFCYDSIQNQLKYRYGLSKEEYYLSTRSKLVNRDWDFLNSEESYYIVNLKVNGGFLDLLKKLVEGIVKIAQLVVKIPNFVIWLVQLFLWVITEILNPIKFFIDLAKGIIVVIQTFIMAIFDVVTGSIKYIVNSIFSPILSGFWGYTPAREKDSFSIIASSKKGDSFFTVKKPKTKFDTIFPQGTKIIIQSSNDNKYQIATIINTEIDTGTIDTGTTKVTINTQLNAKYASGSTVSIPNKYGTGENKGNCNNKKCITLTNPLTEIEKELKDATGIGGGGAGITLPNIDIDMPDGPIPISVIITTIFMPPLGLFMELGFKGWLNIALCAVLTLFYYFPGLIYALIILYC
jgi:uncharacterized membrane protein YqaE (UPF0057 family)